MDITENFMWDGEAGVWVATSDDVPGPVLESGSYDALVEKVRYTVPELIDLNGLSVSRPLDLTFLSKRSERIAFNG